MPVRKQEAHTGMVPKKCAAGNVPPVILETVTYGLSISVSSSGCPLADTVHLAGVNSYHCVNGDSANDKSLRFLKMLPLPSFILTFLASDDSLLFGSYWRLRVGAEWLGICTTWMALNFNHITRPVNKSALAYASAGQIQWLPQERTGHVSRLDVLTEIRQPGWPV